MSCGYKYFFNLILIELCWAAAVTLVEEDCVSGGIKCYMSSGHTECGLQVRCCTMKKTNCEGFHPL